LSIFIAVHLYSAVILCKSFNAIRKLDRKIVLDAARKNVAKRTAFAGSASG
jgi:hypothetical protein